MKQKIKKPLMGVAVFATMAMSYVNNSDVASIESSNSTKIETKVSLGMGLYGNYYAESGSQDSWANASAVFGSMGIVAGVMPGGQLAGVVLGL